MDPYYTITGPRPDLAAIEVNPPEGYIGSKIVPTVPVVDKTGTVYYRTLTADVSAQTARTTLTAPSATAIANSSTTFTCAEKIKRGQIAPDEAKSMGGIARADEVGAKFAKRSVMNAMETEIATITTGSAADDTFDAAKILGQAQTGLDATRRYFGRTTLIGATITLKRAVQAILGDADFGPVLSRIVSGTSPAVATTGLNFGAWTNALAMFLGVDQVLGGDDAIWNAGENEGKLVIGKFDDGSDLLVHKYEPVFARNFLYLPDGSTPWFVESIGDRLTKSNNYDAAVWNNVVQLNSAAIYVLSGVPA
jgi:hypothetical protein